MKYILLAFLLIGSAKAQSKKDDSVTLVNFANAGIQWQKPTKFLLIFNGDRVTNDEVLRIDSAGNMYYKPKYFSECDTSTKMRFLYNIHTGEFKKPHA